VKSKLEDSGRFLESQTWKTLVDSWKVKPGRLWWIPGKSKAGSL